MHEIIPFMFRVSLFDMVATKPQQVASEQLKCAWSKMRRVVSVKCTLDCGDT